MLFVSDSLRLMTRLYSTQVNMNVGVR